MNNVVSHPRRATGSAKALTRKIEADRAKGIAYLRQVIEDLMRLGDEPCFDFAWELVRKYQRVLFELEAWDPDDPPCVQRVVALGRRLENAQTEFLQRIIDAGQPSP